MFVQTKDLSDQDELVPLLEYFVDRTCLPSWRLPRQTLTFHDLTWVLAGRATYWCDGVSTLVRAGDLVYLPRGAVREAVTDSLDPMRCLACNFQAVTLDSALASRLPLAPVTSIGFPEGLLELYQKLNQVWLEKGPGHSLEARGLLSLILHRVLSLSRHRSDASEEAPRLGIVRRHIVLHYAEPVDVTQLAALVRLHPGYFGSWFRKQTGLTVHQYVNRIRVRKAVDLLSTGGFNVSETADKCGFNDLFYFSKVFRKLTGRPPSELIRENPRGPAWTGAEDWTENSPR